MPSPLFGCEGRARQNQADPLSPLLGDFSTEHPADPVLGAWAEADQGLASHFFSSMSASCSHIWAACNIFAQAKRSVMASALARAISASLAVVGQARHSRGRHR